jgi:DNA-binding SARP family transcriptional activator
MSGSFGERGSGGWRRISLGLLGGFELSADDRPIVLPPAAQRVIALLALRRRPLTRLQVAEQLWPVRPSTPAINTSRGGLR